MCAPGLLQMDVPMDRDYERLEWGLRPWPGDGHQGHDEGLLFSVGKDISTARINEQSFEPDHIYSCCERRIKHVMESRSTSVMLCLLIDLNRSR